MLAFVAGVLFVLLGCSEWNHELIHLLVPTNKDHPRICHHIKKRIAFKVLTNLNKSSTSHSVPWPFYRSALPLCAHCTGIRSPIKSDQIFLARPKSCSKCFSWSDLWNNLTGPLVVLFTAFTRVSIFFLKEMRVLTRKEWETGDLLWMLCKIVAHTSCNPITYLALRSRVGHNAYRSKLNFFILFYLFLCLYFSL
jgi:hypothetical protein